MSGILVLAEHDGARIDDVTLELVSAACTLDGAVTVAVVGDGADALAAQLALEGVDEVLAVEAPGAHVDPDVQRANLAALIAAREPRVTLVGFSPGATSWAPAVAVAAGLGFASDVLALREQDGALVAVRGAFNGKAHAEVELPRDAPGALLMLRPATWPVAAADGAATVTSVPAASVVSRFRHVEEIAPAVDEADIARADFVLAVGRGIGNGDEIGMFEELAAKLGATLGASRPLVDAGAVPKVRQVGQSGRTVKPKLYLALGISGAVQHVAGMKGSETIVAVNTDPSAAIFNVAHYGAVADAFELADELARQFERA